MSYLAIDSKSPLSTRFDFAWSMQNTFGKNNTSKSDKRRNIKLIIFIFA